MYGIKIILKTLVILLVVCALVILTNKRIFKAMNKRYEQELQEEILNCEEIQYDNDDVENEYLKHLWD